MPKKIEVKCECPSSLTSKTFAFFDTVLAQQRALKGEAPKRITEEEYNNHDCHASEADGCAVCGAWREQKENESRARNSQRAARSARRI